MPDQISQTLGFDATQAINTLTSLDNLMKTFAKDVAQAGANLDFFNKKGGKTVGLLKHLSTDASKAATQLARVNKATAGGMGVKGLSQTVSDLDKVNAAAGRAARGIQDAGNKGKKAANKWVVSWETMARVIATQALVRALNIVRQSLKAAISDAVDFQRAVAEIGTIGAQMGGLENIAAMVTRISDEFNVSLADTAEAVYQTISNQIAQTEDAVERFTGSAAKFSKVTKTDLATAVNLLSGTLNAFGKRVIETEDVAAKFFKTIELGRTRAEELAQGYGTVAPIADKLGISMEELNASIATLTISGIQTDKAFTQIRGAMQGFLKATPAMEEALRQLGFATGEQILEAYDLQEAIRAVVGTTDENAQSIAKLFPRIRGLTGVLSLAGDETGHFTRAMREQETALEDTYDRAYKLVIETDAERVTKELNILKNFFTTEFGDAVLKSALDLSQLLGGAKNLIIVFESMAHTIPILVGGLTALGVGLAAIKLKAYLAAGGLRAATAAATQLQLALGVIGLAAAAIMAIDFAFRKLEQHRAEELASALAANDEMVEARKKKVAQELAIEKKKLDQLKKFHAQEVAESRKIYMNEIEAIKDDNDRVVSDAKWALGEIVGAREKAVKAIADASRSVSKNIEESRRRAVKLRQDLDQLLFGRKLKGKGEQEQFRMLVTAAAKASKEASELMAGATTEQDKKDAQMAFKKAMAYNEQAYALDLVNNSRSKQNRLNSQARVITNAMIKDEEELQKRMEDEKKSLADNAREGAIYLTSLKQRESKILALVSAYDKAGKPLDAKQLKANRKEAENEITSFLKFAEEGATKLGLEGAEFTKKFFEKLSLEDKAVEIQTLMQTPKNMEVVYNQIRTSFRKLAKADPIIVEILAFAELKGFNITDVQGLEKMRTKMSEAASVQEDLMAGSRDMMIERDAMLEDVSTRLDQIKKFEPSRFLQSRPKEWNEIAEAITKMGNESSTSTKAVNELGQQFNTLVENMTWLERKLTFSTADINNMVESLQTLGEAVKIANADIVANPLSPLADPAGERYQDALKEQTILDQRATKLGELNTLGQNSVSTQQAHTNAVANTNTMVNTSIGLYRQLAATVRTAAIAQASVASQTPTAPGMIKNPYFASGGRGTDTIPAMLSAGEYVTNAKSTRRFFTQLQAMNAGQQPVYREAGGATYNTNVGDINVYDKSGRPSQTARETMRLIQREQRRGSGRL